MTSEFKLSPSILSADFSNLQSALDQCAKGGAPWIHVDVMDNQFVPNLTIDHRWLNHYDPKQTNF